MMLEALILIVGYYIFAGVSVYIYGVIKSHDILGVWNYGIKDGYISGVCPYPRWLLFWIEWVARYVFRQK